MTGGLVEMPALQRRQGRGFSYFTAREGGGRPIVFIHGWCCAPQFFAGALKTLPEQFSGYALDLYAGSERPEGGYTIEGLANAIARFIEATGPAIVLGHSLGGVVAQRLAIHHPALVDRLVLCGTGASLKGYGLGMTAILSRFREQRNSAEFVGELMARFFHTLPPADVFAAFVEHVTKSDADAMEAAMVSLMETDLEALVQRIAAPVLLVHGDKDRGRTMDHVNFLKTHVPDIRVEVFAETGHAMMVERPQRFQQVLNRFLTDDRPNTRGPQP